MSAYGICVDTWSMCLHWAPADARIVVSEIGEIWSPHTAPDSTAATLTTSMELSLPKIATAMGIRIPKVPQEVPVAKASPNAIRKNAAGRIIPIIALPPTTLLT